MEKIGSIKMEINRFDEKSNFFLWQAKVKDMLIQQWLIDALLYKEKPTTMEVQDYVVHAWSTDDFKQFDGSRVSRSW